MGDGQGALGEKEPQELRQLQEAHGMLGTVAGSTSGFDSKSPFMAATVVSGAVGGHGAVEPRESVRR